MDTKMPTLPGFNAEAAIYRTSNRYRFEASGINTGEQVVIPQFWKELKCAAAVAGETAACLGGPNPVCIAAAITAVGACHGVFD